MKFGFAKTDITPRVGVDLSGFGPFRNRVSIGVHEPLWARAMAVDDGARRAVLVSCDLVGVDLMTTNQVRRLVADAAGVAPDSIMVCGTHTHSGPATVRLNGWGRWDAPYVEILPFRIADACIRALNDLGVGVLKHACVPCHGIGLNRVYDRDAPPLTEVLKDGWQPAKPELTDTSCHVFTVERDGGLAGFFTYFGCHPVVCCAQTRWIHGDWCGVATNLIERENDGTVGLFLQGAQGDVNSCVVHKPEAESLEALNVIAERYARSVRTGIAQAAPVPCDTVFTHRRDIAFRRRLPARSELVDWLHREESVLHAPDASDETTGVRMAMVRVQALRDILQRLDTGGELEPPSEVQGLRLGPIAFLGSPFETFQAIKNRVAENALAPIPLVMSFANDYVGYAPDWEQEGGANYAASTVPLIVGQLPFTDIATQLSEALLELDRKLAGSIG